jgi:hypothetical protein
MWLLQLQFGFDALADSALLAGVLATVSFSTAQEVQEAQVVERTLQRLMPSLLKLGGKLCLGLEDLGNRPSTWEALETLAVTSAKLVQAGHAAPRQGSQCPETQVLLWFQQLEETCVFILNIHDGRPATENSGSALSQCFFGESPRHFGVEALLAELVAASGQGSTARQLFRQVLPSLAEVIPQQLWLELRATGSQVAALMQLVPESQLSSLVGKSPGTLAELHALILASV